MRTMAAWGFAAAVALGCSGGGAGGAASPPAGAADAASPTVSTQREPATTPGAETSAASVLAGTAWRAAGGGEAAAAESTPTLTFESPEHVSGSTGCNRFSGEVTMSGRTLRFGRLLTTRRGCAAPVMERERGFLQALEACRSWRKAASAAGRETLELLDEGGAVVLRLEPAPGGRTPP